MARLFSILCGILTFLWSEFATACECHHGVVDHLKVTEQSTAMKTAQIIIDTQRDLYHKEILEKEQALRKENQEFFKSQTADSLIKNSVQQLAFQEDFKAKSDKLRQTAHFMHKQINLAQMKAIAQFKNALTEVVRIIAKKKNLTQVLSAAHCIWFDPGLDITQEVIDLLNKRFVKIEIMFPMKDSLDVGLCRLKGT